MFAKNTFLKILQGHVQSVSNSGCQFTFYCLIMFYTHTPLCNSSNFLIDNHADRISTKKKKNACSVNRICRNYMHRVENQTELVIDVFKCISKLWCRKITWKEVRLDLGLPDVEILKPSKSRKSHFKFNCHLMFQWTCAYLLILFLCYFSKSWKSMSLHVALCIIVHETIKIVSIFKPRFTNTLWNYVNTGWTISSVNPWRSSSSLS